MIAFRLMYVIFSYESLIPPEAVLSCTLVRALSLIIGINVHNAIALLHLAASCGYDIDDAPNDVAKHIYAILLCLYNLAKVLLKIFDTVRIVYSLFSCFHYKAVSGTESALSYEDRLVDAIVQNVQSRS